MNKTRCDSTQKSFRLVVSNHDRWFACASPVYVSRFPVAYKCRDKAAREKEDCNGSKKSEEGKKRANESRGNRTVAVKQENRLFGIVKSPQFSSDVFDFGVAVDGTIHGDQSHRPIAAHTTLVGLRFRLHAL